MFDWSSNALSLSIELNHVYDLVVHLGCDRGRPDWKGLSLASEGGSAAGCYRVALCTGRLAIWYGELKARQAWIDVA